MIDCLELYIKHRPTFMTICDREHLSKISKSLNCVEFREHSVQNKATRISFCHFVNSIANINIALIPSNCISLTSLILFNSSARLLSCHSKLYSPYSFTSGHAHAADYMVQVAVDSIQTCEK